MGKFDPESIWSNKKEASIKKQSSKLAAPIAQFLYMCLSDLGKEVDQNEIKNLTELCVCKESEIDEERINTYLLAYNLRFKRFNGATQSSAFSFRYLLTVDDKDEFNVIKMAERSQNKILNRVEPQATSTKEIDKLLRTAVKVFALSPPIIEGNLSFSWFLSKIYPYRGEVINILMTSVTTQILTLAPILGLQLLIDKAVGNKDINIIFVIGTALAIAAICESVLRMVRDTMLTQIANNLDSIFVSSVIENILRSPFSSIRKYSTSTLTSYVKDIEKIRNFLSNRVAFTVSDVVLSSIYIILMLNYSAQLTLVIFAIIVLQFTLLRFSGPVFRSYQGKVGSLANKTQESTSEIFRNYLSVKAYSLENQLLSRLEYKYKKYISYIYKRTAFASLVSESSRFIRQLAQVVIIVFGGALYLDNKITIGELIAFKILSQQLIGPIISLSKVSESYSEATMAMKNINNIINDNSSPRAQQLEEPKASSVTLSSLNKNLEADFEVSMKSISFGYYSESLKGRDLIIDNLDFSACVGDFVVIKGPSGAGKSSLGKLFARLEEPCTGEINFAGYNIQKFSENQIRSFVAYLPQEPDIFEASLLENITCFSLNIDNDRLLEVCRICMVDEIAKNLPEDYNTLIDQRRLSAGQKQRITLARALYRRPKLLIMDESVSHLSREASSKIMEDLRFYLQTSVIISISHHSEADTIATKSYILKDKVLVVIK